MIENEEKIKDNIKIFEIDLDFVVIRYVYGDNYV